MNPSTWVAGVDTDTTALKTGRIESVSIDEWHREFEQR